VAVALPPEPLPAGARRSVTILGASGSVGQSTLDLIGRSPERYAVEALTAHRNVERLAGAARAHRASLAVIGEPSAYLELKSALSGSGIEVAAGPSGLAEAAGRPADWVMSAIVGAAGLGPTLAAVRRSAMVALATKECLVCAGALLIAEVANSGAVLLPVDSEHNAIFQALRGEAPDSVERLILTASGGPFRTRSAAEMAAVTPPEAIAHPNWSMGAKISVDSATMMNKGLELIEAHHLFGLAQQQIEILVHPESIVHSLVAFRDGSVLAQLGQPDMRIPIAYALGWPERISAPTPRLDLCAIGRLTFEPPDPVRFPALRLAAEALRQGGSAPTVLNAANEVAVAAFLAGRIGFLDIVGVVEEVLGAPTSAQPDSLDDVLDIDAEARGLAEALVAGWSATSIGKA
jgi:1-deoxy-D-xylulose-5-phosphate reductoisomerase